MKKKIVAHLNTDIFIGDVHRDHTIIAESEGEFAGMIVEGKRGFIHRISCSCGSCGFFDTIQKCIEASEEHGYTFYTITRRS